MAPIDLFVLKSTFVSFGVFVIIHLLFFRFISSGGVLKWLMNFIILGLIFNIAINTFFLLNNFHLFANRGGLEKFFVMMVSLLIYGLSAFLYVLCIFGPYESSIRLRILWEFYENHPRGLSLGQLLNRYNASTILKTRLERLTGSKEVTWDGSLYRLQKRKNFFLVADSITGTLSKFIEGRR